MKKLTLLFLLLFSVTAIGQSGYKLSNSKKPSVEPSEKKPSQETVQNHAVGSETPYQASTDKKNPQKRKAIPSKDSLIVTPKKEAKQNSNLKKI
ncbi:MAG: hypothetical protein KAY31_02100 [Flavobacterium sp.]|nr:hypothetical protein [Flavobacterium sp.]